MHQVRQKLPYNYLSAGSKEVLYKELMYIWKHIQKLVSRIQEDTDTKFCAYSVEQFGLVRSVIKFSSRAPRFSVSKKKQCCGIAKKWSSKIPIIAKFCYKVLQRFPKTIEFL